MTIHEFGKGNEKTIVLIHPSVVMWDYFEYVIPLMENDYHLIVPALPGYDPDVKGDFTSVEEIVAELTEWFASNGITEIACIYGCSMGGGIVARMLADHGIRINHAVIDGGITPYQMPWIVTRLIAPRDFLMVGMGKIGGIKLLEKAFSTDEYSDEDLQYIAKVMKMISYKTIWRTFDSCNNYKMPNPVKAECTSMEYWFADTEEKARKWDIAYIRKNFPQTKFRRIQDVGHGGLAVLHPDKLVRGIQQLCAEE